nr:MAG: zinc-binding loop region of homing endonuclease [Bacteriophage sp.]
MEIWKDIQEYEGKYQVSNFGRVKRLWYGKERILKGSKTIKGYLIVGLSKEGKRTFYTVHRLVAEAFLDNPHNYPCINHKDENHSNNNVDNLEWCDYKYNSNYGTCQQRRVEKQSKSVLQFTKDNEFIMEWLSTMECARNGFNQGSVAACCRGERKTHKGFIWRYKND